MKRRRFAIASISVMAANLIPGQGAKAQAREPIPLCRRPLPPEAEYLVHYPGDVVYDPEQARLLYCHDGHWHPVPESDE